MEDTKSSQDNDIEKEEYKVYSNTNISDIVKDFLISFSEKKDRKSNPIPKYIKIIEDAVKEEKPSITISLEDIEKYDPSLAKIVRNDPYNALSTFEYEVYWIAKNIAKDINPKFLEEGKKLNVHLAPPKKSDTFKAKTVKNLNKLIVLEGIVVSKSKIYPHIKQVWLKVEHYDDKKKSNKDDKEEEQKDGEHDGYYPELGKELYNILKLPTKCPICGKRAKITRDETRDIEVDWQKAKLQQRPEDTPPGKDPDEIELVFEDDLVDSVLIGEEVKIVGILKKKNELGETNSTTNEFYVKVVGVEKINSLYSDLKLTKEDEEKIKELAKDPQIVDKIIKSIAPSLKGIGEVKEGIALALFGGNHIIMPDGTTRRGHIHMLVISNPAKGKSVLAQGIMKLAPRSVLATGGGSTGVGLTASVEYDQDLQKYVLRAGALPLANGGVCIIDEIDKLKREDRGNLYYAMEQGIVEINKASIHQKLRANTTVIAFGNPKGGRFDPDTDILEQINLDPALLSRFDLIFTLREDNIDEAIERTKFIIDTETAMSNLQNIDSHLIVAQIKPPIEPDLLRKYIIYAKQNIFPQWSDEARQYLKDYTINLKKKTFEDPRHREKITDRQTEALRRLSEAYARMRLSSEVTVDDVKRAINIFTKSLKEIGIDIETEEGDISKLMTGESEGEREVEKLVLEIIDSHTSNGGVVSYGEIQEELEKILEPRHLDKGSIQKALDRALAKLVDNGDITTVGSHNYKIVKPWHW